MTQNISRITVATTSETGKKLYAVSFIDEQKNHYLFTGHKSVQSARKALAQFVAENMPGHDALLSAISDLKTSRCRMGMVEAIGFGLTEQGEVGAVQEIASRLAYDAASVRASITVFDVASEQATGEYVVSFYSPVEAVEPEPIAGEIIEHHETALGTDIQPVLSNATKAGIEVTAIITGPEETASSDRNKYLARWHNQTQGTGRRFVTSTHYLAAPVAFEVTDSSITPVIVDNGAVYANSALTPIKVHELAGEPLEKAWKRALKSARGVTRAYREGTLEFVEMLNA